MTSADISIVAHVRLQIRHLRRRWIEFEIPLLRVSTTADSPPQASHFIPATDIVDLPLPFPKFAFDFFYNLAATKIDMNPSSGPVKGIVFIAALQLCAMAHHFGGSGNGIQWVGSS
jgi:hypothetical protein